ncbi:hypothetical protein [Brumimicrobium sp.]|uniref:hypothetical protein n=1 Tax=Brumimicrobium sp. TaxID=2029867 RepID=UPI003A93B25B
MDKINKGNAISNWIKKKVLEHEPLLILLILVSVFIHYLNVQYSIPITIIVLSTAATIYYIAAFAKHEEEDLNMFDLFLYKLCGISCSVSLLGILFSILEWPGDKPMNTVGTLSLAICLIYMLLEKRKRPNLKIFNKSFILRVAVLLAISAYFMIKKLGYIA